MKKVTCLLLTFAMAVSLAACGGGGNSTADKAASKPGKGTGSVAAEWDVSKEKTLKYKNGQVLIDTEDVRISASALKNKDTDKGMALSGTIKIENLTDGEIRVN